MSLDVYLYLEYPPPYKDEDGEEEDEWGGGQDVFRGNVTHNLTDMAKEAGIYQVLWHPEKVGITKAIDLIPPLKEGLKLLLSDPERFKKFNPENGWGDYHGFVEFVRDYLRACKRFPTTTITVSR